MVCFPQLPPLILDGTKKLIRIVSKDNPYKNNADLVLNYEGIENLDLQFELRFNI
jgi:hypothetical protein